MLRLNPTLPTLLMAAGLSIGCTGPTFEGAWRGPFPLEGANDCRMRLWNDGRFDLSCRDDSWIGAGSWMQRDGKVVIDFQALAHKGKIVEPLPQPMALRYDGAGNTQCFGLATDEGEPYCWHRGAK